MRGPKGWPGPCSNRRAQRHARHHLDPAGDHRIVCAADHALRREMDRLLAGAALPVDRRARHALGEAGRQRGVAPDIDRLLADLADAARDHVVDQRRVDPGALRPAPGAYSASRSTGCQSFSCPPRRPIGVRTASTITASRGARSLCCLLRHRWTSGSPCDRCMMAVAKSLRSSRRLRLAPFSRARARWEDTVRFHRTRHRESG